MFALIALTFLHCVFSYGDVALYLLGIPPTHFASFPHPFASFPHQICFVSPKKCFISPTVCCISPTKCFISPTVSCISLCNVVSRCQKIFYQIFLFLALQGDAHRITPHRDPTHP